MMKRYVPLLLAAVLLAGCAAPDTQAQTQSSQISVAGALLPVEEAAQRIKELAL